MDHFIIDMFWFNRIFLALIAMVIAEANDRNKFFWGILVFIISLFWNVGETPHYDFQNQRIILAIAGLVIAYIKKLRKPKQLLLWCVACGVFHMVAFLYLVIIISPPEIVEEKKPQKPQEESKSEKK